MDDAHSGFGSQQRNVVSPIKIMTDSKTQKFQCLNFFVRIVKKGDEGVCQMFLMDRESERE